MAGATALNLVFYTDFFIISRFFDIFQGKIMRKSVLIFIISALFIFTACGGNSKNKEKEENPDSTDMVTDDDTDSTDDADDGFSENDNDPDIDSADDEDGNDDPEPTVAVGDIVVLGTYEQDNDTDNGKEPIEWRVRKIKGAKALMLAEKGLDARRFDEETGRWKDSEIRAWLNSDFYNEAFSSDDKKKIVSSSIETGSVYDLTDEYTTADNIFLFSSYDVEIYFPKQCSSILYPTEYAKAKGVEICDEDWCRSYECGDAVYNAVYWWLRSPGYDASDALIVSWESLIYNGYIHHQDYVVRPAFWMWAGDRPECENGKSRCSKITLEVCANGFWNAEEICGYTCNPETVKCEECESGTYRCSADKSQLCVKGSWNSGTACEMGCEPSTGRCSESGGFVGNVIKFGTYEQDNNMENGKEPIEWKILDMVGNKGLILAEKGLDARIFNEDPYHRKWEESEIRTWLNSDFYNAAFSSDEKKKILSSEIETEIEANSSQDYVTTDKVFLLSLRELNKYFPISDDVMEQEKQCVRIAYPTEYAKANGAEVCDYDICKEYECGEAAYNATEWWIRTPASIDRYMASCVDFFGRATPQSVYDICAVRPALWIEF